MRARGSDHWTRISRRRLELSASRSIEFRRHSTTHHLSNSEQFFGSSIRTALDAALTKEQLMRPFTSTTDAGTTTRRPRLTTALGSVIMAAAVVILPSVVQAQNSTTTPEPACSV